MRVERLYPDRARLPQAGEVARTIGQAARLGSHRTRVVGPAVGASRWPFRVGDGAPLWATPSLSLACSALMFAAIFLFRVFFGDSTDPIVLLYALPTALLATTFGPVGGIGGAVTSIGLYGVWVLLCHPQVTIMGWIMRAFSLFLVGGLLGQAASRTAVLAAEARAAEDAAELLRERHLQFVKALEINDVIVQNLAVAKWRLESGAPDGARELIEQVIVASQRIVSELLPIQVTGFESATGLREPTVPPPD